MKRTITAFLLSAAFLIVLSTGGKQANGDLTFDVFERSGSVVFLYSGSVDLLSTFGMDANRNLDFADFDGNTSWIRSVNGQSDDYNVFFTSSPAFAGAASGGVVIGDYLLIEATSFNSQIWLPDGYMSGQVINGRLIFHGTSFQSSGLSLGETVWTWQNGQFSDSATIRILSAPVPEPSSLLAPLLASMAFLIGRRAKRRQTSA